jgi:FkbM family methyltransferase
VLPAGLTLRQRGDFLVHLLKALTQQHHRPLRPLLTRHIAADAVVCDVGAHAGQFAKLFAALAPCGRVYAFEPGGYARAILERVVRWRGLRNVQLVPFGLSDQSGDALLFVPLKPSGIGFGLSHLGAAAAPRGGHCEPVRLTTLDQFAASERLERLDFLKADIEGWEIRMLRGGLATIARWRPALLLELNAAHLQRAGSGPGEAWDMLGALQYRAHKLAADGSLAAAPNFAGDGDYFFTVNQGALRDAACGRSSG